MEPEIIIILVFCQIIFFVSTFKLGFIYRERLFQTKPIQFIQGVQNSVWISNEGPKTKIVIQNKNLVDIVK